MEHYVTLFDSLFLPQGLALHASMQRHAGTYTLWVLCMDEEVHDTLRRLALPNVHAVALADVETPELLRVKSGRTRGEYCWTLTPFTPKLVFDREPTARRATYLDADVWFRRPPAPIFSALERSGKAVLITEHAYAPEFEQSETSGRFCVQFVTFERERGESVRRWWADRCVEWCFARVEHGKFGDQMYLDCWPERFAAEVHVLERPEMVQGPWNTARFPADEALVFHFHGLRLMRGGNVLLSETYPIFETTDELLYRPYCSDFSSALVKLQALGVGARPQLARSEWMQRLKMKARALRNGYRMARDSHRNRIAKLGAYPPR